MPRHDLGANLAFRRQGERRQQLRLPHLGGRASALADGYPTELVLGQTVDTNSAWLAEQLAALARHNLPQNLPADISTESILTALRKDKKFHAGAIRFVLLRNLGDAFVSDAVTIQDIERAIECLR